LEGGQLLEDLRALRKEGVGGRVGLAEENVPAAWEAVPVAAEEVLRSEAAAVAFLERSQDGRMDCGFPSVEAATQVVA
jgi:hypothetical protein